MSHSTSHLKLIPWTWQWLLYFPGQQIWIHFRNVEEWECLLDKAAAIMVWKLCAAMLEIKKIPSVVGFYRKNIVNTWKISSYYEKTILFLHEIPLHYSEKKCWVITGNITYKINMKQKQLKQSCKLESLLHVGLRPQWDFNVIWTLWRILNSQHLNKPKRWSDLLDVALFLVD